MKLKISALVLGVLVSAGASAQEYGLALGVHQTSASVDKGSGISGTVDGKLGFDIGLQVAFELIPNLRFRTGVMYDQRPFDFKMGNNSGGTDKYQFNFAYVDVPVNVQYNFTPVFSVFGGLIVGVKASDSTSTPANGTSPNVDMKTLYPLLNAGVNLTFDDMIGFDFYVEHGIGEFATDKFGDSLKDYNTFGLRFIYWM